MSWDLERMSDVRLLVLADVVGYRSWPAGPCPRSQRHVEEASGTGRGIRWQVAGGRWQEAADRSREAGGGNRSSLFVGGPEVCRKAGARR